MTNHGEVDEGAPERLIQAMRNLGLYEDKAELVRSEDGRCILLLQLLVGDLAFSNRVQDPIEHDIDQEFRLMTISLTEERFREVQRELMGDAAGTEDGQ